MEPKLSAKHNEQRQYLYNLQTAYQKIFNSKHGKQVLADLKRFCRDRESTFNPDPRVAAMLDGRREVILRVKDYLELNRDELWELKTQGKKEHIS